MYSRAGPLYKLQLITKLHSQAHGDNVGGAAAVPSCVGGKTVDLTGRTEGASTVSMPPHYLPGH